MNFQFNGAHVQKSNQPRTIIFAALAVSCLSISASAQARRQAAHVTAEIRHDVSAPLRDLKPLPEKQEFEPEGEEHSDGVILKSTPIAARRTARPMAAQTSAATHAATTAGLNFDGISYSGFGSAPSDANGAVGATQYVQVVNARFAVYDKTSGVLLMGPVGVNTIWSGFGGDCQGSNLGDPIVVYDKAAARWVISRHAATGSNPWVQCVAVSSTSDATGSYHRYSFPLGTNFPDYPKLSVWPDAYYLTNDMLIPPTFKGAGANVCALDRAAMIAGQTATSQCFQLAATTLSLLPADLDGATPPPAGSPNYIVSLGTNALNFWKFHVDWQTPANTTLTGPSSIPVAGFTEACNGGFCIPQGGTTQVLDSVGDRLLFRFAYRNYGAFESLVVAHTVSIASSAGVRWYEIRNPGGTPVVFQQGTFSPDTNFRWVPSVAMDKAGDLAVGYSVSSNTMSPSIRYTGRVPSDALNTLEAETSIIEGTGSQINNDNRWGDYTAMTVDPVDDCTFWYTNQYLTVNGGPNWHTRIASFSFPSCAGGAQPAAQLSSNALTFGSINLGSTQTLNVSLINTGVVDVTGLSVATTGDYNQTSNCGTALTAGAACTINVTFQPTVAGNRIGTLSVSDNAVNTPQTASLSGIGIGMSTVTLSPTSADFGNQTVASTSAATVVTLTNAGTAPLNITSITASGDFAQTNTCGTLVAANSNCTVSVTFTPTVAGSRTGTLTVTDDATSSPQTTNLAGTGVAQGVVLSQTSIAYGNVATGNSSSAINVTLTNGHNAPLNIASIVTTGDFRQTNTCGTIVAAAGNCVISVTFVPAAKGVRTGTLTVTDDAANTPQTASLSGTGIAPVTVTPSSLNFGTQAVGTTSAAQTVTLRNKQNVPLTFTSIVANGNYSQTNTCGASIPVGGSCTISVKFTPTRTGALNGTIKVTDSANTSPQAISLTGSGV